MLGRCIQPVLKNKTWTNTEDKHDAQEGQQNQQEMEPKRFSVSFLLNNNYCCHGLKTALELAEAFRQTICSPDS